MSRLELWFVSSSAMQLCYFSYSGEKTFYRKHIVLAIIMSLHVPTSRFATKVPPAFVARKLGEKIEFSDLWLANFAESMQEPLHNSTVLIPMAFHELF